MENIYSEILKSLEKKEKAALATIISRTGSAPRAVGAQFLVRKMDLLWDPSEGVVLRPKCGKRPRKLMEKGRGSILQFNLTAEQLAEGGLICGGNVDIFVEPLRDTSSKSTGR